MFSLDMLNPVKMIENTVDSIKNVGEAFIDLAEGDFAGAAKNAGEAFENNPLMLNGAGFKALGELLEGDVAGAGAAFVEGAINSGSLDDVAKLFGVENLGAEMAAGLFGDAVRNAEATAAHMKNLQGLPPPRGRKIAAAHTPQRPSAYAKGKRGAKGYGEGGSRLPSADPQAIRDAGGAGLSVLQAFQNEMVSVIQKFYPILEKTSDGKFDVTGSPKDNADARRAAKDAAKAKAKETAKAKALDQANARVAELGVKEDSFDSSSELIPEEPKFESAVAALKPPVFFEDLIAAFMTDLIQAQQDTIREKTQQLNEIQEQRRALRKESRDRSLAIENGETGAAGGAGGGGLGDLGKMVGGLLNNPAVGAAAMALIPPPFNLAAGLIGPAFDLLSGLDGGAGGTGGAEGTEGGDSLKAEQNKTLDELDETEDSLNKISEEIKQAIQLLEKMEQTLSNILNSMHETAMNAIGNIR